MGRFLNTAWRLVYFLVAASIAIIVDFLLVSRLTEIEVVTSILNISQRLPFPTEGWMTPYLATGFLYSSMFYFIDADYEYDSAIDRLMIIALPFWWPLGVVGEILAEKMIITSDGKIRRVFAFLYSSIFFRMLYLLALGIGLLLFINGLAQP